MGSSPFVRLFSDYVVPRLDKVLLLQESTFIQYENFTHFIHLSSTPSVFHCLEYIGVYMDNNFAG